MKTKTKTKKSPVPQQKRLVVSYPINDDLYGRCMEEVEEVGVTHSKMVRDALAIAFAHKDRKLRAGTLPRGVACFRPERGAK